MSPKVLLLDISGLTFMDSSGVRLILQAEARAAESSRRLAVLAGTGLPARVLSLLGFSDRLELIADRAEVLGATRSANHFPDGRLRVEPASSGYTPG